MWRLFPNQQNTCKNSRRFLYIRWWFLKLFQSSKRMQQLRVIYQIMLWLALILKILSLSNFRLRFLLDSRAWRKEPHQSSTIKWSSTSIRNRRIMQWRKLQSVSNNRLNLTKLCIFKDSNLLVNQLTTDWGQVSPWELSQTSKLIKIRL